MKMHINHVQYMSIQLLHISKPLIPNYSLFIFFFFLFKFIGLIIFSNSYEFETNNKLSFSIANIARYLTIFNALDRIPTTFQYDYILPFLYLILLIPIIIWVCFIYKSHSSQINQKKQIFKQLECTLFMKTLIKINTYIFIIIIFCSQHLVEYLLFPIVLMIQPSLFAIKLTAINDSLVVNNLILTIVNYLFVILINFYLWIFFKFFNYPFLSHRYVIKFTHNNYFLVFLILVFNFQGYHLFLFMNIITKTILTIISLVLSIIMILFATRRIVEKILYNYLIHSYLYFAIFSSIMSFMMYYTSNDSDNQITSSLCFTKCVIQFVFMLITNLIFVTIQDKVLNKIIQENILIKERQVKGDYLFQLTRLVKDCIEDKRHFSHLFELIEENNIKTKMMSYSKEQNRLDLINFLPKLKEAREKDDAYSVKKRQLFKEQYNDLLVLIETEIIAYISSLLRARRLSSMSRFSLLHCDFIYYFKMNMCFSLYLIQEYLSKIKDINYESIVYFYSLKQNILEERERLLKHDQRLGSLNNKFKRFFNYFQTLEDIKHLLNKCCSNYQEIIAFKNIYSDSKFRKESNNHDQKLETLFNDCNKIDKLLHVIQYKIISNFGDLQLKNPEVSFLLINFYSITQTKVPIPIQNCIIEINNYDDILQFDSAFLDHEFEHPMIFSLSSVNKQDKLMQTQTDFFIFYASQKLINILGYKERELVGKEYHILQPKMFAEPRATELKRLFFLKEDFQIQKHHFLLSKDGYYIKTKETSGIFPSLNNDTLIITNLELIKDDYSHSYQFVTDFNLNILAITQEFEEKYRINYEMINRLGLTFVNLFCLNIDKIKAYFKKEIVEIESINIEPINNLVNVLSYNTYNNMIIAYEAEAPEIQSKKLKNDKKKRQVVQALGKIKKQIEEQEYDTDWISRICIFEQLCNESLNYGKLDSEFEIHIQLKNVANYPYYTITLFDNDKFPMNKINGLTTYNKLTSIKEVPQETDYVKKYQDSINKARIVKDQLLLKKFPFNNKFVLNNNNTTSIILNDTHQQLINSPQKNSFLNQSLIKQSKLISKQSKNKNVEEEASNEVLIYKRKEMYFSFFVIFLVSIITIIFIVNFFLKNSGINMVQDTAKLIFNIVKLKESILESALLITSGCYQLSGLEPNPYFDVDFSPEMIKSQLYVRSAEMYYFYNEYMEYLKKYHYIKEIQIQLDILSLHLNITSLNPDFTIKETQSTFDVELNYFHFHCGYIKTVESFTVCRIKDYFLGGLQSPKPDIYASDDEVFFYYTSENIIKVMMNLIDQLINQSSHFNYLKTKAISKQFMIFNLSILSIWTLLLFSVIILIYLYTKRINAYLMIFMIKSEKTIIIERRLNNFKRILESFDHEVLKNFEEIKEKLNEVDEIDQVITTKSRASKNKNSIKKKEKDEDGIKEEVDDTSKHNSSFRIFSLKLFRNGIGIFVLSFLVSVGLIVINVIIDESLLKEVLLSSETSFSYLDHITSINELLLFYRVSILYGNPNFAELPRESFNSLMFYYRLAQANVNTDDSRYKLLGQSKMAFLYYRSNYEGLIISFFEDSHKNSKLLPLLKEYNLKIDIQGEACRTFSSSYSQYINDFQDSFDEAFLYNACMKLEDGSSDNGITKQINNFLYALFDEYIDFSRNPTGDLSVYSQGSSFISMLKLMTFIYDVSWHIRVKIIAKEYEALFFRVKSNELIFQIASLILSSLLCSFYMIFIVQYVKLTINRFGMIIEKIKVTLND